MVGKRKKRIVIVQGDPEAVHQSVQVIGKKGNFTGFLLYDQPRTYGSWQESFI